MIEVEIKELEETIDISVDGLSCVILYNDDWHTFDEVIVQIMLATSCTEKAAVKHTFEVHNTGQSKVYTGALEECLGVSAVLEEIALKTEVVH